MKSEGFVKVYLQRKPLIYLITDGSLTVENFAEKSSETLKTLKEAIFNKIPLIQIREKQLPAGLLFKLALQVVQLAGNSGTKILINDRADIALASGADGVHLTANSVPARIIRENFPANFIIGVSAHSPEEAEIAKSEGADFAVLGPVFPSPNKDKPLGLNVLRQVCEKLKPFPTLGLGGIDETNYREVLQIAGGFAAIRFLNKVANLQELKNEGLFDDCGN